MFQEYFAQNPQILLWPLLGLGIFLVSFLAVLIYVFVGLKDRKMVAHLSSLPLEPDSPGAKPLAREKNS